MTLKLVHDATNVETIPVNNLMDIAGELNRLGMDIDEGKHGDVISVIAVIVTSTGLSIQVKGGCCTHYQLMGLFEAAKLRVFADDVIED